MGLAHDAADNLGDLVSPLWQPYNAYAVKRFLEDHARETCAMDFGAGHSIYDGKLFESVNKTLASYNVVLLMPSSNHQESVRHLADRNNRDRRKHRDHNRWNQLFIEHPSNHGLARFVVYTKGKSAEETCAEVINRIQAGLGAARE